MQILYEYLIVQISWLKLRGVSPSRIYFTRFLKMYKLLLFFKINPNKFLQGTFKKVQSKGGGLISRDATDIQLFSCPKYGRIWKLASSWISVRPVIRIYKTEYFSRHSIPGGYLARYPGIRMDVKFSIHLSPDVRQPIFTLTSKPDIRSSYPLLPEIWVKPLRILNPILLLCFLVCPLIK